MNTTTYHDPSTNYPKHFMIKYQEWWDGRKHSFDYFWFQDPYSPDPEKHGINDLYTAGFYNISPNIRHYRAKKFK